MRTGHFVVQCGNMEITDAYVSYKNWLSIVLSFQAANISHWLPWCTFVWREGTNTWKRFGE